MDFNYEVFFTEPRGTGIYTRVKIDTNDGEPIVVGFDIPGDDTTPVETINNRIVDHVTELAMAKTNARETIKQISDISGTIAKTELASRIQKTLNETFEFTGTDTIVIPDAVTTDTSDSVMATVLDAAKQVGGILTTKITNFIVQPDKLVIEQPIDISKVSL